MAQQRIVCLASACRHNARGEVCRLGAIVVRPARAPVPGAPPAEAGHVAAFCGNYEPR
ncbi:MAG: DUF1540 domain-containing protein [Actinomycetia bacterium]|nr:DUF1540 domain-containing protein [Actinomycetes bacterium]